MPRDVLIVGASAAGLATAEALRNKGYDGRLTLVGDEACLPYDRPPLSKQVLSGAWQPERVRLRDEQAIDKLDAEFQLGRRAVGLDAAGRKVLLDGGERVAFDALVIATGVTPRRLPGDDLEGVHVLRTLDDALALRADLLVRPKVVVVGAGFLGAEVAAVAGTMGLEVTLVDPLPVPMRRQFGDMIGKLVGQTHSDHGVALRLGVGVARFVESAGRVAAVELADGTKLDADVVVVGVGSTPATDWLADSGLVLGNGVECDAECRAAPGVYAAGDVASWHNPHFGVRMRVEHRLNATEQGMAVAANILGEQRPFAPVPYFWSDQYDARVQAYGIFPEHADVTVMHGSLNDREFVAAYGHEGEVVGVLGWNSHRELRTLRQLVVDHAPHPGERTAEGRQEA
ncbi:NAD(P)/FAD-dependent oxidoreductase [Streptomyces scopuliridis]|uniref:NAD(P)/FAD-dependent oxidoreductase n=1 Tax=Streptomyces scopuliridis TaxID=452529 RepID=UPI003698F84E